MDDGRKADLAFIERKLGSFDLKPKSRAQLEHAREAIAAQNSDRQIRDLRGKYTRAVQAGDKAATDKFMRQLEILEKGGRL